MKLKYIFLSLLTLATLSGCDNEELIGPGGNNNNQGEGLPAVLMINGSTNENVETKADNSKDGDLYVFVFNADGTSLLGKGCSTDEDKSNKIATIVNTNVVLQSKDVIVVGDEMLSGTKVDVILIANPPEDVVKLYNSESISLKDLSEKTASLDEQIRMYENNSMRSTSCQRITMTLNRGINFCGESREGINNSEYQTKKQIPLYRLISEVRLMQVKVLPDEGGLAGFTIEKVYLKQNTYYDNSVLFPKDLISIPDTEEQLPDWCLPLANKRNAETNSRNLVKTNMNIGALNSRWLYAINVTSGENNAANYDETCTLVDTKYAVPIVGKKFKEVTQSLYSFEGSEKTVLVVVGHYGKDATPDLIIRNGTYCKYEIEIPGDKGDFQRNHIYNVYLTIHGVGDNPDDPDPTPGSRGASAKIEIANMAEQDVDFEFGGK